MDLTNPQSLNRYAYVMNDPMDLADPLGLDPSNCGNDSKCWSDWAKATYGHFFGGAQPFPPLPDCFDLFSSCGGGFSRFGVSIAGAGGGGETSGIPDFIPFPTGSLADFLPDLPRECDFGPCGFVDHPLVSQHDAQAAKDCIDNFSKTKLGKAVEFGSPLSVAPGWSEKWKKNLVEWTILPPAKALGVWLLSKGSRAVGATEFLSIITGQSVTVAAPTEAGIGVMTRGAAKIAPYAIGAATLTDIAVHSSCMYETFPDIGVASQIGP
ncbi:MAG TPA: hypothetical protein VF493_17590, partial [Terriglobales bacterium]